MILGHKYLINRGDLGKRTLGYIICNDVSKGL